MGNLIPIYKSAFLLLKADLIKLICTLTHWDTKFPDDYYYHENYTTIRNAFLYPCYSIGNCSELLSLSQDGSGGVSEVRTLSHIAFIAVVIVMSNRLHYCLLLTLIVSLNIAISLCRCSFSANSASNCCCISGAGCRIRNLNSSSSCLTNIACFCNRTI